MTTRIQLRRDTAANWTANNPTLAQGEFGYELDTKKFKIGDGLTAWNSLAYAVAGISGANAPVTYDSNTQTVGFNYSTGLTISGNSLVADFGTTSVKVAQGDHTHGIPISFVRTGTLTTGVGSLRWYNDLGSRTIDTVRASVGVAPTGSSIIVDVNVNGTSIFSSRPVIGTSTFTTTSGTKTSTPYTIANGAYVTVDVDQIGSTIAGSDLTVTFILI